MSLHDDIRSAQIRAGEDAVIRNLKRLGLVTEEPKENEPGPRDWYGQWRETQAENTALRELLREWYALFSPVRREGTEGAQLLDKTQQALTTKFRYAGPNDQGNGPRQAQLAEGPR